MSVLKEGGCDPEALVIASEAFSRSWHFIERDPVLAGHDRETLQAELAVKIQDLMATARSERDPLRIVNRAISAVRDRMGRRLVAVDLTSSVTAP